MKLNELHEFESINQKLKEAMEVIIDEFINDYGENKKSMKIVNIPTGVWVENFDYIISKCIFHNLGIEVNGFCGGGYDEKYHKIIISALNSDLIKPAKIIDVKNLSDKDAADCDDAIEYYKSYINPLRLL